MEEVRRLKIKYQLLLFEPRLLKKKKKDWLAYSYAARLYSLYVLGRVSEDKIKNHIQQIRTYDVELAKDIEDVLPIVGENFGIFSELLNELKKGSQYFVVYISTHSKELIEKAEALKGKDTKLSKQLIDLINAISGHEVDYLMQYKTDCEHWINYAVRDSIDFFINRISLFLNGGFDNRSGTQFMGLYKDFKDEKIQGVVLRNKSVRNLGSYLNQLKYLGLLIGMCRRAYLSGDWNKGFFGPKGFWADFEKYANDFERVYGNVDFKERLIATERKKEYELPQFWGGVWERSEIQDINVLRQQGILYTVENGIVYIMRQEGVLTKLLMELYSRRYQVNNIIHPAAAALIKIFEERENELIASRNQKMRDLIKLLLGMFGVPKLRKFRKLLSRKKHQLFDELITTQNEFTSVATTPLKNYDEYIEAVNRALVKISPEFIQGNRIKFLEAAISNLDYMRRQLSSQRFDSDKKVFMRTMYSDAASDYADIVDIMLIRLEHLDKEYLDAIERIIIVGNGIMDGLRIVERHIRTKLEKVYVARIDDIPATYFEIITNRTFDLGYIKSQFDNELKRALIELQ